MRAGEFTITQHADFDAASALCPGDNTVDSHQNPTMIQLHLKQSNHSAREYLYTSAGLHPPASAILAGPLFVFKDRSFFTRDRLVANVRQALSAAGIETRGFSGHSFWIGTTTMAAVAGIEDSVVKLLGRWVSSAYLCYLCTPRESLAAISSSLVT